LVLTDEIARRDNSATERRAREARLDRKMTLEHFDKSAKITYDKRLFAELCSLRFLETHKHVVLFGPVGVGKTFLAHALGHIACRHGYKVLFTRADMMLHTLKKGRLDNSRDDEMLALTTVEANWPLGQTKAASPARRRAKILIDLAPHMRHHHARSLGLPPWSLEVEKPVVPSP
jgi:hypothetical protein